MGFHNVQLPDKFFGYGSSAGPGHSTSIPPSQSGIQPDRFRRFKSARRQYRFRQNIDASDAVELMDFVLARRGAAHSFLIRDLFDYTTASDSVSAPSGTDQAIGTGDGVWTEFQLAKHYTSGSETETRKLAKPVRGTIVVAVGGTPQTFGTDYSIDHQSGRVSFVTAPSAAAAVTAGCEFRVQVRFTKRVDASMPFVRRGPSHDEFAFGCIEEKPPVDSDDRVEALSDLICYGGALDPVMTKQWQIVWTDPQTSGRFITAAPTGYQEVRLPDIDTTGLFSGGMVIPGGPYFVFYNDGTHGLTLTQNVSGTWGPLLYNSLVGPDETRELFVDDVGRWRAM